MNRLTDRESVYSIVELMVVVVLIGILASIAIPQYVGDVRETRAMQCAANRGAIIRAMFNYVEKQDVLPGDPMPSLADLVDSEYFSFLPVCTSGGVYYWSIADMPADGMQGAGCSVHQVP